MSIQSEINRIAGNIAAAYDAAEEKGAEMPEDLTSDNLAETIATITGGGTISSPTYTYTGDSSIVIDDGGWKLKLLTSGTLRFASLGGAEAEDIFLVGGGGSSGPKNNTWGSGGGGGGYTSTQSTVLRLNTPYEVVIGAGGAPGNGGSTSISGEGVNFTIGGGTVGASEGEGSSIGKGNGGSGGGARDRQGGSDGGSMASRGATLNTGVGQGTTTREFGEVNGTLYAGGGNGSNSTAVAPDGGTARNNAGSPNTGAGGGGSTGAVNSYFDGGSGILIIRNHRGATV